MPPTNSEPVSLKIKYTAIPLKTITYLAWRNLISKKLRTFLTIFGVIIGIGAIFFLLSFGMGIQNLVTKEIVGNSSVKSIDISSANTKIVALNRDAVEKIKNLPHVDKTGVQFLFSGSLKQKGSSVDTIVYGVDQGFMSLNDLTMASGQLDKRDDNRSIMLNETAVKAAGYRSDKDVLGKTISLAIPIKDAKATKKSINGQYTVVGVVKSSSGSEVYQSRTPRLRKNL